FTRCVTSQQHSMVMRVLFTLVGGGAESVVGGFSSKSTRKVMKLRLKSYTVMLAQLPPGRTATETQPGSSTMPFNPRRRVSLLQPVVLTAGFLHRHPDRRRPDLTGVIHAGLWFLHCVYPVEVSARSRMVFQAEA